MGLDSIFPFFWGVGGGAMCHKLLYVHYSFIPNRDISVVFLISKFWRNLFLCYQYENKNNKSESQERFRTLIWLFMTNNWRRNFVLDIQE